MVIAAGPALALPAVGSEVPAVTLEDRQKRTIVVPGVLPAPGLPTLVLVEDKDSGAQNQHIAALLVRAARPRNWPRLSFVPVADVSAFDFWAARRFVLANIKGQEQREGTTIWLDWKAALRRLWSIAKGKSTLVLIVPPPPSSPAPPVVGGLTTGAAAPATAPASPPPAARPGGIVRFAAEGPLTPAQIAELTHRLEELGVDLAP